MAEQVLLNCQIFHGGYDLSGKHNEISLAYGADIKDKTPLNVTSRRKIAGLCDAEISGGGFWSAADLDAVLFNGLTVDDQIFTISPSSGAIGSRRPLRGGVD